MIPYILLIAAISVFEIKTMIQKKLKKELGLFIALDIISLGLAWIYSLNPYGISIAGFLALLGING